MNSFAMSRDELEGHLTRLATRSLELWGLGPSATAELWSHSESAIYLVRDEESETKTILRVNREGYNSTNAITCELAWLRALREEAGVMTPTPIPGRNGALVQSDYVDGLAAPRDMVLFEFIEGTEPDESHDLVAPFERLGEVSARIHNHSQGWTLPVNFERLVWSFENILGGQDALWGDWRAAPAMDGSALEVLERLAETIRQRLRAFGKPAHRWGLIHGDLRLANLLIHDGDTRVIDFDDCGLGWYVHDFATALSFIEDHPNKSGLTEAWLRGYRRHRDLSAEDEAEIPTFIMLRRMQLLAWIGSHGETDLAREQGPDFTRVSCELAEEYLSAISA